MSKIHRFPWASRDDAQIWIVGFGSKSTPLIAQLCREVGLKSRILEAADVPDVWQKRSSTPKLIILSGGDQSVYDATSLKLPADLLHAFQTNGVKLLGICYGAQLLAHMAGGEVKQAGRAEYGEVTVTCPQLFGEYYGGVVVMNHGDEITRLPAGWKVLGSTERCEHALIASADQHIIAVQFHPEMDHTHDGEAFLRHVALTIAGCEQDYSFDPNAFIHQAQQWLVGTVGDNLCICGVSGGVDSAVVFAAAERVLSNSLHGVFVNTGTMRLHDEVDVRIAFPHSRIVYADASQAFYAGLEATPLLNNGPAFAAQEAEYYEETRGATGRLFYETFAATAKPLRQGHTGPTFLLQGTNAADIVESAIKSRLKTHHNLVPLPDYLGMDAVEPLASLYKFEIREAALALGLSKAIAYRQPFPGPGLVLRTWGKFSRSRIPPLQQAEAILEQIVSEHYPDRATRPCQYYVALAPLPTTGLMGDARVIGFCLVVRMVWARRRESFATVSVQPLTQACMDDLVHRLTSEVRCEDGTRIVQVFYALAGKPPATTEMH